MKAKNLCVYAGLCAGVASVAVGQSQDATLQQVGAGAEVSPIQIAKVIMQDGKVVFQSDWMAYNGNTSRANDVRIFDCFGDVDSDGVMDDTDACDMGGSRWFFGTGFSNLFYTNDMVVVDDTDLTQGSGRADFAWYWTCDGGFSETCVIALFTQDSEPCDEDSGDYSGWLLDFGTLECNPGGYFYTNVDINTTGTWPLPTGGAGSYLMIFAQEVTTGGAFVMATLAQPMLWGTGDDIAGYTDEIVGTQDINQFDEVTVDLSHTISECFTYSTTSICPQVLGAMMQFWGARGDLCYADFNGDGTVNTQDFLAYLGAWAAGDMSADCNDDGVVNTQDFLCFLGLWAAGC